MIRAQYIPWAILLGAVGLVAGLWSAGTLGASRPPAPLPRATGADDAGEKHFVTPQQLAASNDMVHRLSDVLELVGSKRDRGGPLVLVFIKQGCPCSAQFEPFFQRVEHLYHGAVRFVGVIDANERAAHDYAVRQHVPYPVVADPQRRIIGRMRAENGGYFALLRADGMIDGFWPGCSAEGMRELGQRIARLAGWKERPLDVHDMPGPLTTGCPFEP